MPGILARYRRRVPRRMQDEEWRAFVSEGTRTGKLATSRHDGRPHVVPIWFVLDGDDFIFTTNTTTVKGKSLQRDGRAALCVDDERPPFAFVAVTARSPSHAIVRPAPLGDGHRRRRYMGADRAEEFGSATPSTVSCSSARTPTTSSPKPTSRVR